MSAVTGADIVQAIRDHTQSESDALADALILREANRVLDAIHPAVDDRPRLLPANTTGLTTASGTRAYSVAVAARVREPLHLYVASSASSVIPQAELERVEPHELHAEWERSQDTGTPVMWSARRAGTDVTAEVGLWRVALWNTPNATIHLLLEALVDATAIVGSTEVPDLSPTEVHAVEFETAARLAHGMGRAPEFVAELRSRVPEQMHVALGIDARALVPRIRPVFEPSGPKEPAA